ncbi:MAG TPA: glycoside hydrolase family 97 catalytic domain-containing protein [Acidobacteriaceae bacterium]
MSDSICCTLRGVTLLLASAICTPCAFSQQSVIVRGPGGGPEMQLRAAGSHVSYVVRRGSTIVVEPSALSLRTGSGSLENLRLGTPVRSTRTQSYAWYGVHAHATVTANEVTVPVLSATGATAFVCEIAAFRDGIAFRLILPGSAERVPNEVVSFKLASADTVWSFDPTLDGYEGVYHRSVNLLIKNATLAAPPVVAELPGRAGFVAITEASLGQYHGSVLKADGHGAFYIEPGYKVPADRSFRYFQGESEAVRLSAPVAMSGTITTPWQVIMVARTLNELVNNDMVSALSPPPDAKVFPEGITTDWIKPGRAIWNYLDGGERDIAGALAFSVMAGKLGFEYQVLEGQWMHWSEDELRDVVSRSRAEGVGIWLWKNRKDLPTPESREKFFAMCNRVGVVGVKVDFFDHESAETIALYRSILEEAARHHLMVNFHGADKPTGEQRTWPNELTREGIEGLEHTDDPWPLNETTLPFTRLLAGPGDFTPVLLRGDLHGTTAANQIASAVIMTSPLLTYAGNPAMLLASPAVSVICAIPSTWDETVVLPSSRIGDLAIFARRKGSTWFVAGLSGDEKRLVQIRLSFLGKGGYRGVVVSGSTNGSHAVTVTTKSFRSKDIFSSMLNAGDGFVLQLTPASAQ